MTDWIVVLVGCFATVICVVATMILVYAVETDVKEWITKALDKNKSILGKLMVRPWRRAGGWTMLVLSRKVGERIRIAGDIEVVVMAIHGDRIKIGIEAPKSVRVLRGELPEIRPAIQAPSWMNCGPAIFSQDAVVSEHSRESFH
jgi:carbon storage regulator CsrA